MTAGAGEVQFAGAGDGDATFRVFGGGADQAFTGALGEGELAEGGELAVLETGRVVPAAGFDLGTGTTGEFCSLPLLGIAFP